MEFPRANTIQQINAGPYLVQMVGSVTLGANPVTTHSSSPGTLSFRVRSDDFLWTHAFAVSTSTFRHRLKSEWEGRDLDNDFVRSELFWGSSLGTALAIPPKWMPLDGQITFTLEDTSNASNTVELYLVGMKATSCGDAKALKCTKGCDGRCDRLRFGKDRGLFVLSTPSLTGGVAQSNGTGDIGMLAEDAWHFRVSYLHAISRSNANNKGWKGNIEHKDPRECERQFLANAMMTGAAWTGAAATPNLLPSPMIVEQGSEVSVTLQDTLAAGAHTVDFSLIGERLDEELLGANA